MRGVYTVSEVYSALATAKALFTVTVPATIVLEILEATLTNRTQETNEQLYTGLFLATAAGSGTKTDITADIRKHEPGDKASAVTVEHTYGTSEATIDENIPLYPRGHSSIVGYAWQGNPEQRLYVPPSGILVFKLLTTSFTAFDAIATLTWREIG